MLYAEIMPKDALFICKAVHKRLPNECRSVFKCAWISFVDDESVVLRYPYPRQEQALEFTKILRLIRPDIEKSFKKVLHRSISVKFSYFDSEYLSQFLKERLEDFESSSRTSLPVPAVVLPVRG